MVKWLLVIALLLPAPAFGFSIGSAISDFCHERITLQAYQNALLSDLERIDFELPGEQAFAKIADYLSEQVNATYTNDAQRLVLMSLFLGVRYPDQEGFAVSDLTALRALHMSEIGQEDHCLRGVDMDGPEGNQAALTAAQNLILELADESRAVFSASSGKQRLTKVPFWLEHYGTIQVEVWEPGFLMGRALHTIQDSFPHTYRSDDGARVFAVANFVDGLSADHEAHRDGPRHSDILDQCNDLRVTPLADAAQAASVELMTALKSYWTRGDRGEVEAVVERWMSLEPNCGFDDDYCDSQWATLGATELTTPPLSCAATAQSSLLWLLALIGSRRRR